MYRNIYPIININEKNDFSAEFVLKCFQINPFFLQIRVKNKEINKTTEIVKHITAIRNDLNLDTKIIVNDFVEAALSGGADGVHLGQTDNIYEGLKTKKFLNDFIVGYSTHTLEEIETANNYPVDYIGFGPVFKTESKQQKYGEVFNNVKLAAEISKHPIVFIGGINIDNITLLPEGNRIYYAMISGLNDIFKGGDSAK